MKHYKEGMSIRRHRCALSFAALTCSLTASASAQTPSDKAWSVLRAGLTDKTTEKRAVAVRVLGLLESNQRAEDLAGKALVDSRSEVRTAAGDALGQMKAKNPASKLADVILSDEKEIGVLLACARSMIALGDNRGYVVYYAVLTGERKSGGSLLDDQKKMLSEPKKMAQLGFEQGIGFVPFGGIGYAGFKMMTKDDSSPVRAAASRVLANDPDPKTGEALDSACPWLFQRWSGSRALLFRGRPTFGHCQRWAVGAETSGVVTLYSTVCHWRCRVLLRNYSAGCILKAASVRRLLMEPDPRDGNRAVALQPHVSRSLTTMALSESEAAHEASMALRN